MKLTVEHIEHIKAECEQVDYGRIIIELNATTGKIDVVTEKRRRFLRPLDEYCDDEKANFTEVDIGVKTG